MKKDLKQRIKQDELVTGYEKTADYVATHRDEARVVVLTVAVAALVGLAWWSWQGHRKSASEKAFSDALVVYHSPTAAEIPTGQQAAPGITVHATETDKFTKARAAFQGVVERYGSTPAGRRARYYVALSDLGLGKAAEAEKELTEIAKGSGDDRLVPGLARLALAESHRTRGQLDQAIEAFRRLADEKTAGVPPDHALMRLASTLEDARRTAEAGAAYKRLADEFPASVYAAEARRKADSLGTRG
jgi:TolA-binding protein